MARSAVRRKTPITPAACFHAHQCAEKYLKAVLVARQAVFPKTHDLTSLFELCGRAGVMLSLEEDDLDTLSEHAVRARYPGAEPSVDDARAAIRYARTVRGVCRRVLGLR
jgi:HEPN domain-containing protein